MRQHNGMAGPVSSALFALLVVLASACGSGATGEPTPNPTLAPAPTVDAAQALEAFDSGRMPYQISVPSAWTYEEARFGADRFYVNRPDTSALAAELFVECLGTIMGRTKDARSVLEEDVRLLQAAKVPATDPVVTEYSLGSIRGFRSAYRVAVGPAQSHAFVAYLEGDACAWRVKLIVWRNGNVDDYEALFDRILRTFQPQPLAGAGP